MEDIHNGEIWAKSQCLGHEKQIIKKIATFVEQHGFEKTDHFRVWKKDNQTVLICLVDDIITCSDDYRTDLPYLYDRNTTVITDNYLTCPSIFQMVNLPVSFFGIYNYVPGHQDWNPIKDFSFLVNRIDYRRFYLMLDLANRTDLDLGYVNFNCQDRTKPNMLPQDIFASYWKEAGPDDQRRLAATYQQLTPTMPLKNYTIDFDSVAINSWLNIIIETYSSDNVISLSEKIFRALVTPAPWTVYSGRYTVAYLESLGFDCMTDIIDHSQYDSLKEAEGKLQVFNMKSLEIINKLKDFGIDTVRQRCIQAATTNQRLLKQYYDCVYPDIESWLSTIKLM